MSAVQRVAIAGAGMAGLAAAILLAEDGVDVDVYEIKPELTALGSGITLQGNALRSFARLGIWDEVQKQCWSQDVLTLRAPGPDATVIATIPDARTGGPDFPAAAGMFRPDLAQIMLDRATELGARVHFGRTIESLTQDADGVDIKLSDGTTDRVDLLIGADGINSAVRSMVGIDVKPEPTGMGIWRAFVPRPAEVTSTDLYYGGPMYIAGYCPTSEDMMYAYLVEDKQDRSGLTPEQSVEIMRDATRAYGGPWNQIRDSLGADSRVNYTWFTSHLIDGPWNRGRVVLIGDAAHSCPPTIAQGGAQATEDALVLCEILARESTVDDAVWEEFTRRRLERARTIVEASLQLGRWQLNHEQGDVPGLIGRIAELASVPA
ncbi:FAD-dependent monooxygenase [Pseudolysinimonas yzui]|uniref:FAD-dependent oxidoreductase n=1 Tax=Pseudolysinimonas yzui TaxID=2708254 RepID=A0A8J3GRA2_9MICO|nr:FAD-dependent monooxygenase [Pseudolysinimonas yzui]GHF19040.1 FAD-dependent oxidoreductase [Pseudolysinimonas yzui]